ncbi:alpha/beta fold hydrolase [Pontibacter sp. JAM-7]|uniref:alpha/beta fold hydrolase n=1 Tax=Pontibacter sp. JAM-7 TaxID=3366581 RepID=UPI003AF8B9F0
MPASNSVITPIEITVSANGYQFSGFEYGNSNGIPVLALHGWLDNAASFHWVAKSLPEMRFIAIDLAGHGASQHRPLGMPYQIWDYAVDMLAVADSLGLTRFALLGHSMGASVAMLMAALAPDRVSQLGLLEGLAPLVYPEARLPELMAGAIRKRNKWSQRPVKPFSDPQQAIAVRMSGRWPVNESMAAALVDRGLRQTGQGWIWSHDPSLVQPSLLRFSQSQVRAFVQAVKAPGFILLATDFARKSLVEPWRSDLVSLQIEQVLGEHHFHMTDTGAALVAARVRHWLDQKNN